MEIKHLYFLLKQWYWLLIVGLVVGAASGILISKVQNPVYEATTKILIMRAPQQSDSSLAYLSDVQLTQTFGQLITIQPVLDEVSSKLGFKVFPTQIQFQPIQDTQIVKVIVEDNNPQRAALIANTSVEVTIQRFVGLQTGQNSSSETDIQAQIDAVESQITGMQSQISQTSQLIVKNQMEQIQSQMAPLQTEASNLQKGIALLSPSSTPEQNSIIAEKQARLNEIQPLLNAYQQAYSNLLVLKKPIDLGSPDEDKLTLLQKKLVLYQQNYIDLTTKLLSAQQVHSQNVSNVMQIETAPVPISPVHPQILINTLLAGAVGLMLAVIGIFLIDSLYERLKISRKTTESIQLNESKENPLRSTISSLIGLDQEHPDNPALSNELEKEKEGGIFTQK
jgi:capsular polysaccharide biosynthesis protein